MLMLVFEKRYIFIKFLGIFHLDTLLFVNSGSRPCTGQLQVTTRSTETQRLYWSHIDFMIATCHHHHHHPYNFLEIRVIPLCEVDDKHRGKFLYNSKNV